MSTPESREGMRRRLTVALSHFLLIIIIFILPELMLAIAMPHRRSFVSFPMFYVKSALYILVFYINYLFIIDRTICRARSPHRIARLLLWNLLLFAAVLAISYIISQAWTPNFVRRPRPSGTRYLLKSLSFLTRDTVMLCLTVGLAVALKLTAMWKDIRQQQQEILTAQRVSELQSLKSQLNPHFLFNTLNTIYALIALDQSVAQDAVHRLSTLLRYVLYDEQQGMVALKRETDFVENYAELMKLRMGRRPVNISIDTGTHADSPVPALLFIPLVENAFKYGSKAPEDCPVSISIKAKDELLQCSIINSFVPSGDKGASGIGLANLRRRLTLLYGNAATLEVNSHDNVFIAQLFVPMNIKPQITAQ